MDIFDSGSMTPPDSPPLGFSSLRGRELTTDKESTGSSVYCWTCKGPLRPQDKSFSPHGLFLRNHAVSMIKLLRGQSKNIPRPDMQLLNFFGHQFDPTQKSQLKTLVRMCRKNIYTLENLAQPSFSFGHNFNGIRNTNTDNDDRLNPFQLRSDVCSFLNYIVSRRVHLTSSDATELFGGLKKSLERTRSWTPSLQHHCGSKDGNECTSAEYHLFHLQIELRWFLILIFELSVPVLNWVLDDLIYLAHIKYTSREGNLLEKNPFNCYCVKELWAMLRVIVEQLKPNGKDFWDLVTSSITRLDTESDSTFPLWLISNLATLSDYGINGVYAPICNQKDKVESSNSCYIYINQVLKQWVQHGGKILEVTELILRLLPYWGFDLEVVLTLWSLWVPKIDKGFDAKSMEPYSSALKWLELISAIASTELEYDSNGDNVLCSDPFLHFLRLLSSQVKLCHLKDWRKLKSNICNRFSQKTVDSYSESGLTRVATLYLTLIFITTDTESMCERLQETLNFGKDSLATLKLKARCTMLLLLLKKGINVSNICLQVMRTVNEIMGMSVSGRTATHKELIMIYIDFLDNIPKFNGDLSLGQSELISLNLTMWLSTCGPNYVNRTLRVLHNLLAVWIMDSKVLPTFDKETAGQIIQEKTEQFLKQTVISSQNRNPEFDVQPLADLAVDLTILQSSKKNSIAVGSMFGTFALNSNTSPVVSEIYIERIMRSAFTLDIYSLISEHQLIQAWIRLMTYARSVPVSLTSRVLGLPQELLLDEPNGPDEVLKKFCSVVCEPGSSWTPALLHTILVPVVEALKATKIKSFSSEASNATAIVKAVKILFQNLPFPMIYQKNNQSSFVHQVLEVCCPNFVGKPPWEKLPDTLLGALITCLPSIFVTVISYQPWLQDPFLKRKTGDLIRFAILGFTKGEDLEDSNPGLCILLECEQLNGPQRGQVIQEIANSMLSLGKEDQIARRFLLVLIGFLRRRMLTTVVYLLGSVLELLIERTELSMRCRNVISVTWANVLERESYSHLQPILLASLEFTMKKHFAFRSERFFDLFSTLASNIHQRTQIRKFLQDHVIPLLTKHVELSEAKQGSGTNYKLRGALQKFIKELQI